MDNPIEIHIDFVIIIWMFPIMKPSFIWAKKEIEKLFQNK